MSSSACCMSRHPPSPDGIAPRPAVSSPPKFCLDAKTQDLIPQSWSSGSRFSKAEDAAAIQAIFEEDKLDSESEHRKVISKKASTTLNAVKNRLKKHLSKDSGIANSKRHSRSSVGTTEEEVERRAELRRIRQKRIQEELSSEGVYDDDAKSLSTVGVPNISPSQKEPSWTPGDSLPSPALALPGLAPKDPLPTVSATRAVSVFNQKGPMLEALYFGLMSPQQTTSISFEEGYFPDSSTTMVNSSATRSRRYSLPAASTPEFEIPEPNVYRPTRKRSSLPQLPKAPMLQPQRLPSIVEPAKSSWRLSFSADNRAEHLRKLSQGTNIASLLSLESSAGQAQPTRKWLHSQGLRSSSQAIAASETSNLEFTASHSQTCTASEDFGNLDGVGESTSTLHLHEMGISQRLASKGLQSSCSSPQLSSIGSRTHQRGVSNISAMTRSTHRSRYHGLQNTTDSLPLSERIPETWGNVVENGNTIQDGASSIYPSDNNSIQPSPQSSQFNLPALLSGSKSKADLSTLRDKSTLTLDDEAKIQPPPSTFMRTTIPESPPLKRNSVIVASASSNSLLLPSPGYHRRPTVDTNSTFISETDSFREREAELSVVRTRFAAAEACRSPSTPRSSKFREEFDFTTSTALEEATTCKPSAFSRLAKFAARSFDGPFERKLGIPMTPMTAAYEPDELHHHSKHAKAPLSTIATPVEDGSVSGFRENAVKRNAEPRIKDVAGNLRIPGWKGRVAKKSVSHGVRKKSHVSNSSKDKRKHALKGLGWGMGDEPESEPENEGNPEDDWEAELARVAQKAKGKSRAIVKKYTEPDRRYPASWSRFSRHDRKERTSSAKADDRVEVRDFATDGSEFLDKGKKTLREKIQRKLIAEYDKQATAEVQNNTAGTFGRRSSMRPAGDLEYPELEVLPLQNVSLMSHEEIAEHVEEVLKEEELDRKEEELDAIFGPSIKRKDTIKDEVKRIGRKMTPQRTGTNKTSNSKSSNTDKVRSPTKVTENTASNISATDAPVKRGPVARKPGEQATSSAPKPAPKIAPPVAMPVRDGTNRGFVDGSSDHGDSNSTTVNIDDSVTDDADVSIADPRFYDDCIVNQTPGPEKGLYSEESGDETEGLNEASPSLGSKKCKYKTWSGKDWDKYRQQHRNRQSLGTLILRQSTDEVLCELQRLENIERENALRAAEEAWGGQ